LNAPLLAVKEKTADKGEVQFSEDAESSGDTNIKDAANYTLGDITMVRYELLFGFLAAGLISIFIPVSWWQYLFMSHSGFIGSVENLVIAPFIAVISFVCSVGNIPFAAALWRGGISFGGAISFIYADLIAFPLILIYRKYFGTRIALKLLAMFWLVMSLTGGVVDVIFHIINEVPRRHIIHDSAPVWGFNLNTVLNCVALASLMGTYIISKMDSREITAFAIDPVCGMQVRKSEAPASAIFDGTIYYFCMEGCRDDFLSR